MRPDDLRLPGAATAISGGQESGGQESGGQESGGQESGARGPRGPGRTAGRAAWWRSPDLLRRAVRWETGLAVVVVVIGVLGASASSQFLTGSNMFNLGLTTGEIAIMTLPMTLIVITGEIDLSVASIMGMASALLGYLWFRHWPMLAILAVILVAGALAGLFNGLLVTRLGLPSLAVTIGTLALYRGIAVIILGSATISNFPSAYVTVGIYPVPHTDLSYSAAIFGVLAVIFAVVLHATKTGRSIYAIGANSEAALFAGIRVKRIKTALFTVSGVLCAMAGALLTFRLSTAVQNNGSGLELDVVAIVLLAGVSIFGGKGSIGGVVLAVLAFAGIQNALLLTNFNQEASGIVTGALLLVSVFVPNTGLVLGQLRTLHRSRDRRRAPGPAEVARE
ncbi:MAG: ABC transporter permease [Streptosporangiaceae bacterium]